jgi:hypothetical protein
MVAVKLCGRIQYTTPVRPANASESEAPSNNHPVSCYWTYKILIIGLNYIQAHLMAIDLPRSYRQRFGASEAPPQVSGLVFAADYAAPTPTMQVTALRSGLRILRWRDCQD